MNRRTTSVAVDIAIFTDMGSARNYINVLTSDVVVACGEGGAGTVSEIALALKAGKFVVLFHNSNESRALFKKIGGRLVFEANSVAKTIDVIRKLLAKMARARRRP